MILRRPRGWRPGQDVRAVRHPATTRPGSTSPVEGPVLVAGGGIAGMAAAVGLAERGVPVIMVEPYPQLGGRVRAWPVQHGGDAVTMSRGFHAFFRQYYNLRGLLRRVDPGLRRLTPLTDYPLVLAGGHTDSFARIPRTPPLNMAAFVAQSPSFRLRDLAAVDVPAAMELLDVDFPDTFSAYDGESADQFLDRLRFPDGARHLALEVFARSFFAHPKDFSAGELVAMFHAYFLGSSEGLLFDVPDDDYETAFWGPLRHYLAGLGVELRLGDRVTGLSAQTDAVQVTLGSGPEISAAAVVVATDPLTTRDLLLESGVGDDAWRDRVAALRTAPPFAVWRIWLDRLVDPARPPFIGTAGFGPLDNISVLERFEDGARRWSSAHGGSVVELHAYALVDQPDERDAQGAAPVRAAPDLPRADRCLGAGRGVAGQRRLPAGRHRTLAGPADRAHARPPHRPRRRRHPLRLSGGADGTRRHHRLPGRQPVAGRPRPRRARSLDRPDALPQPRLGPAAPPAHPLTELQALLRRQPAYT